MNTIDKEQQEVLEQLRTLHPLRPMNTDAGNCILLHYNSLPEGAKTDFFVTLVALCRTFREAFQVMLYAPAPNRRNAVLITAIAGGLAKTLEEENRVLFLQTVLFGRNFEKFEVKQEEQISVLKKAA